MRPLQRWTRGGELVVDAVAFGGPAGGDVGGSIVVRAGFDSGVNPDGTSRGDVADPSRTITYEGISQVGLALDLDALQRRAAAEDSLVTALCQRLGRQLRRLRQARAVPEHIAIAEVIHFRGR